MKFLTEKLIDTDYEAFNAEDAIQRAGTLLVNENSVEHRYIEAMIESYRENGSYFVLSPKIALPHARPEDGVKDASVSLVRLKTPVEFGHKTNDPVSLIFGLGATSGEEHLKILQRLTRLLNERETTNELIDADSSSEIIKIIEKRIGQ